MDKLSTFNLLSKGQWEKATVVKKVSTRSYILKVANGRTFRRNRKHLRQTNEALPNMSVIEQGAEDEAAIPTTIATQQTHENDQYEQRMYQHRLRVNLARLSPQSLELDEFLNHQLGLRTMSDIKIAYFYIIVLFL